MLVKGANTTTTTTSVSDVSDVSVGDVSGLGRALVNVAVDGDMDGRIEAMNIWAVQHGIELWLWRRAEEIVLIPTK